MRVVIFEDIPMDHGSIAAMLPDHAAVVSCRLPGDLDAVEDPATITHAIVDLAYRPAGYDGRSRHKTGVDAFLALDDLAPNARRVVFTAFDGEEMKETARAIIQFWPGTVMLRKQNEEHYTPQLKRFLAGYPIESDPVCVAALANVPPIMSWNAVARQFRDNRNGDPFHVIDALCRVHDRPPTLDQVLAALPPTVKSKGALRGRLTDLSQRVQEWRTDPEVQVGAGLWHWFYPRKPIFDRLQRERDLARQDAKNAVN